jgi:hypothetical protein
MTQVILHLVAEFLDFCNGKEGGTTPDTSSYSGIQTLSFIARIACLPYDQELFKDRGGLDLTSVCLATRWCSLTIGWGHPSWQPQSLCTAC